VRVREDDERDLARVEVEPPVLADGAGALEHAAFDEELHLARVDEVARAGDFAGCAEERELHRAQG
jgi:hypothetical protein